MPISPTVNAYMAQDQGQAAPQDQDSLFKKSFSDHAFNALRAKASAIIPYVIAFRCFDFNIDEGEAFGAFIMSYGNDLIFIPIVMNNGSITSCEMAYLKEEDRFVPLSDDFIKKIVNENSSTMAKPFKGSVRVEDTRQMFRNIVRPPMSSNVVFASRRMDVSELPNEKKAEMADYLKRHPRLLGKIAEFYPVEVLAERLAPSVRKLAEAQGPMLYKLGSVTADEVGRLSVEDRRTLLERGWLLKNAEAEPKFAASPEEYGVETILRCAEYTPGSISKNEVMRGEIVRFDGGKFKRDDALLFKERSFEGPNLRILAKGERTGVTKDHVVLGGGRTADEKDLKEFGFKPVTEMRGELKEGKFCFVLVPRKRGGWSVANQFYVYSPMSVSDDDGTWRVRDKDGKILLEATDKIKYGSVKEVIVPKDALLLCLPQGSSTGFPGLVGTLQDMFDIIRSHSVVLRVAHSDGITEITDTSSQKTASFASRGDAASWLNDRYGLSERQIVDTFGRTETMLLSKFADGYMANQPIGLQGGGEQPAPQPQPQLNPQGNTTVQVPQFTPNNMGAFAAMEDPEMIDVGILSSFAGDQDVKQLLVEYIPDFVSVLDRIGRIVLLFCIQRRELEQYYRVDKLNELLQNCRKVFKIVGDLVQSLQVYVNMA